MAFSELEAELTRARTPQYLAETDAALCGGLGRQKPACRVRDLSCIRVRRAAGAH